MRRSSPAWAGRSALVSGNLIARISEAREAALAAYGAGLGQLGAAFEAMRQAAKIAEIAEGGHRFYGGSHEAGADRDALDVALRVEIARFMQAFAKAARPRTPRRRASRRVRAPATTHRRFP